MARFAAALGIAGVLVTGCRSTDGSRVKDDNALPADGTAAPQTAAGPETAPVTQPAANGPKLCVAARGNGPFFWTHFAGLARILEHYGVPDGISGGSSGSITSFFYESVLMNPVLRQCSSGACTDQELGVRAALQFKSMLAYFAMLGGTDEAMALKTLLPLADRVKTLGLEGALASGGPPAALAMNTLLNSKDIRDIANQELVELLKTSPNPGYHAQETWKLIQGLGKWTVEDKLVFFRPGPIDFRKAARKFARLAGFYAGYGPYDVPAAKAWLDACAPPSKGLLWEQIAPLPGPNGATCGAAFDTLLKTWRTKFIANEATFPSRADDKVGGTPYVHTLVPVAILEGATAADEFKTEKEKYFKAQPIDFNVSFGDIKIGYYGRPEDLTRVAANERGYTDLKTQKLVAMNQATWTEALAYSPAEPGLTRLQEMSPARIGASGWFELFPTTVLRNIGCQEVVYLTRPAEEGEYPRGVARGLGMKPDEEKALYDLSFAPGTPVSSLGLAISEASAVACMDWGPSQPLDAVGQFTMGYNAPYEVRTPFFTQAADPAPNAVGSAGMRGCTVGAP